MSELSSYRSVLRSSSIIGSANAVNYLMALVRVKIIAVLLGPAGVGLVSLYTSAITLAGTVSGFGIASSGVREVALAFSQHDTKAAARTVRVLRRVCWFTGFIGWALAVALAPFLSCWVSGSKEHAWAIALLGGTLLLGSISGGQMALLQGVRNIGDIARANIMAMLINTCVAIGLYALLGQQGIVPVMALSAVVSLFASWWFARKVDVESVLISWRETVAGALQLAGLGFAFMWSALLIAGLDMATRSLLTRELGISAAGHYQAAWAISGMFAGFILSAMGSDFYPRLTGAIHDKAMATRTVNEQTEIGLLLALPGLLATLAFAPWLMEAFYTRQFLPGAILLPWFVLGVFGRVVSWPLGYIQLAKGASRWFITTETLFIGFQLGLVLWMVPRYGLVGVGYSFAATYVVYPLAMLWLSRSLIGFRWSPGVMRLLALSGVCVGGGLAATACLTGVSQHLAGGLITLIGGVASLRGLAERLGQAHAIVKLALRLPGGKWLLHGIAMDRGQG